MLHAIHRLRAALKRLRSPYADEKAAVDAGMQMQMRNDIDARLYRLCRHTHALEKALMMPDRRSSFGERYIRQSVDDYEAVLKKAQGASASVHDAGQLPWVHRVLSDYFKTVKGRGHIEAARQQFDRLCAERGTPLPPDTPPAHINDSTPACYTAFADLARHRKSVRWFAKKPVPRQLIDQAMDVARFAPSACNRQPYVFHVVDESSLVRQVLDISWGVDGFKDQVPVVVVVVGRLRAFAAPHDRHLIYVDGSLAAMTFMLSLETLGLASCPINWPDVAEKNAALSKLLCLSDDERAVILMAVGYPAPGRRLAESRRRSLERIRNYVADA